MYGNGIGAVVCALVLCAAPASAGGRVHHVPLEYPTIQAAVDAAAPGETVLVADGVYSGAGNRDIDMHGKDIVVRSENGPAACIVDVQGSSEEPRRGFVFASGESRAARVEGFTIRGGATAAGAIADQFNGGGIQIVGSSPTIADCVFEDNRCGCWGGAVYSGGGGSPLIERCLFRGNSADDDGGAFFSWNGSAAVIVGCVFVDNSAPVSGGAIATFGGSTDPLQLIHVTVVGNSASFGGAIAAWGPATIESSIVWDNPTVNGAAIAGSGVQAVTYSNVQGGHAGFGNIDAPPRFAKDGFHLATGSPCIDAGRPGPPMVPFDVDAQPRLVGPRVDIGADESLGTSLRR